MCSESRDAGIEIIGEVPWGTHFCHFYQTQQDLRDTVIPFLKAGLEHNEQCLWIVAQELSRGELEELRRSISGFEDYLDAGAIEFPIYSEAFLESDAFDPKQVIRKWQNKAEKAVDSGFAGLRIAADVAWVGKDHWEAFSELEQGIDRVIAEYPMILMCAYPLETIQATAIFDVSLTHRFITARQRGEWRLLETPELIKARADIEKLNQELEQRIHERTRQLAEANEQLERKETLFASFMDFLPGFAYIKDANRRHLFVNKPLEEFLELESGEWLGKTFEKLFPIPEAETVQRNDEQILNDSKSIQSEEQVRKNGSLLTFLSVKFPIHLPDGTLRLGGVSMDITGRKQAEEDLVSARKQAEAANKAKSEFLANMSHEIRTPLNGILGMLQVLQMTDLDEQQHEYTQMAVTSSKRLTRLLNDILDLSRIEADSLEVRQEDFQLVEIMQSIKDIFKQVATKQGNILRVETDPRIPERLKGDDTRVTQILFNLAGNACKFTSSGWVDIQAYLLPVARPGEHRVLFTVSDTGKGIPDDKLEHVFEPFAQLNDAASPYARKFEGAGLGLLLVKRLVRRLGGSCCIVSEPEHGTTVFVSLPFSAPETPQHVSPIVQSRSTCLRSRTWKVLLAEDDAVSRVYLKDIMENLGLEVYAVRNGEEVLAALHKQKFDCVLMDIQMPVLDGVEAARRIRTSQSDFRRIPIIAITAYAMKGDRQRFLKAGMNDYVPKPVDNDVLYQALQRHLVGLAGPA
jgi:PAS domain S-box-containing protein